MKKIIIGLIALIMLISGAVNAQWEDNNSGYSSPWIFFDNSFPVGQSQVGFVGGMYTTYNGDGVILKTDDAGETWSTILGGTDGSINGIEAIFFTSTDVGYAGGWQEDVLFTDDGGDTWSDMEVGTDIWYYTDAEFWDADNGIFSARLNSGASQVWVTDDAGETWTAASGIDIMIVDVDYADANTLFAVGSEEDIIISEDGGLTWELNHDGTDPDNDPLLGVHFYDANFGVVGGMDGLIKITTNGGDSWSDDVLGGGYPSLYAIYCVDENHIYAGGTDGVIYETTNGGSSWGTASSDGTSTLYEFGFMSNGTGFVSGAGGNLLRQEGPFGADFFADVTTICAGETVNFTDNSSQATGWDWTFDGGTPSTSTEQNPSVVYDTPGVYDVTLTVTDGTAYDTETKYEYITVNDTPAQADTPTGDEEICTSNFSTYLTAEVDYAEDYEWELSPTEAGTLTWALNQAELETTNWTGSFTLKVRALNSCGDGEWSPEFSGSIVAGPEEYEVTGGGSYCDGDEGVEVGLDGSESGVDYELFLDGTSTGTILEGTGSALSFGLQTEEGYYSIEANNGSCDMVMTGQVAVIIMYAPLEPQGPTGPESVCSPDTTEYMTTGSDGADSYMWTLSPEEAGTLLENDMSATVYWNMDYTGTAMVSVSASNLCGEGSPSSLEVIVETTPSPMIEGEELVCDNHFEDYSVTETTGSAYTWTVDGGTITDGEGTYMITVEWGDPGTGSVIVAEVTEMGCEGQSEEMVITIDDCTDISDNGMLESVDVYPNPTSTTVNIRLRANKGETYTTSIYNMLGQKVFKQDNEGTGEKQKTEVAVSSMPEGLYIIQITTTERILWQGKYEKVK